MHRRTVRAPGFSVVELILVVTIAGVLVSIAVPGLVRYVRKTRTVEVTEALAKITAGAKAYYAQHATMPCRFNFGHSCWMSTRGHVPRISHAKACARPDESFDPSRVAAAFAANPWPALGFKPSGPTRYRYSYFSVSVPPAFAHARIEAMGDLDCDGSPSMWRVTLDRTSAKDATLRQRGPWVWFGDEAD